MNTWVVQHAETGLYMHITFSEYKMVAFSGETYPYTLVAIREDDTAFTAGMHRPPPDKNAKRWQITLTAAILDMVRAFIEIPEKEWQHYWVAQEKEWAEEDVKLEVEEKRKHLSVV